MSLGSAGLLNSAISVGDISIPASTFTVVKTVVGAAPAEGSWTFTITRDPRYCVGYNPASLYQPEGVWTLSVPAAGGSATSDFILTSDGSTDPPELKECRFTVVESAAPGFSSSLPPEGVVISGSLPLPQGVTATGEDFRIEVTNTADPTPTPTPTPTAPTPSPTTTDAAPSTTPDPNATQAATESPIAGGEELPRTGGAPLAIAIAVAGAGAALVASGVVLIRRARIHR